MDLATLPKRFWKKVTIKRDGCWQWKGARSDGYGMYWLDGRTQAAHRVAYRALVGTIPAGVEVDHHCCRRECVNPAHLRLVTHKENLLYGNSIQAHNARKHTCAKGHPLSVVVRPSRTQRRCLICSGIYMRDYHREYSRKRRALARAAKTAPAVP